MYCVVGFNPFFSFWGMPDIYKASLSRPLACLTLLAPRCLFWGSNTCFRRFSRVSLLPSLANQPSFPLLPYPSVVVCSPRPGHAAGMVIFTRRIAASFAVFRSTFRTPAAKVSCRVLFVQQRSGCVSTFRTFNPPPPKIPPAKALQFVFKGSIIVV